MFIKQELVAYRCIFTYFWGKTDTTRVLRDETRVKRDETVVGQCRNGMRRDEIVKNYLARWCLVCMW